ncbi:hypothetical protein CDD82_4747 [Ophiocordyceps australis]|uniref:Uncharacterized protein n=1 Tax=Ophiocordyceps australis TaxID=1399860 RepID=A0A2C5Z658_9HYPO|nr:hypothetical protein CDD82_4747 [Ophiocordyceps australis]
MDRQIQIHWTQDYRFRHLRSPPAWYHRRSVPFWTPQPSARMEKQASFERKGQWQWQGADNASSSFNESCLEATCWPCGLYARTVMRLHSALAGHDAEYTGDLGLCNADCTQYAACLPFYGFFVSRLQTTIRSFYGIGGKNHSDWYDGCCCPCVTLIRSEQEILLRERQYKRLRSLHDCSSASSQYQSQTPMTYDSSPVKSSTAQTKSSSSPTKSSTAPTPSLSPPVNWVNSASLGQRLLPRLAAPCPRVAGGDSTTAMGGRVSEHSTPVGATAPFGLSIVESKSMKQPRKKSTAANGSKTVDVPVIHYLDNEWYMVPVSQAAQTRWDAKERRRPSGAADGTCKGDEAKIPRKPVPIAATLMGRHSLSQHELVSMGASSPPKPTCSDEEDKTSQISPRRQLDGLEEDASVGSKRWPRSEETAKADGPSRPHAVAHDATGEQVGPRSKTLEGGVENDGASHEAKPAVLEASKDVEYEEAPRRPVADTKD